MWHSAAHAPAGGDPGARGEGPVKPDVLLGGAAAPLAPLLARPLASSPLIHWTCCCTAT